MPTQRIDLLNTVLIVVSFLVALFVPFHLFLFAYAVLGPLHYLTEIPWLHSHNYFTKKKTDGLVFLGVGVCLTILFFESAMNGSFGLSAMLIVTCFLWSIVCLLTERNDVRIYAFIVIFILASFLVMLPTLLLLFGVLLPTLIHVYVFTLLFMLYGARKNNSMIGYGNVFLVCLCVGLFFMLQFESIAGVGSYVKESYLLSFGVLHETLGGFLGKPFESSESFFSATLGIVLMQCIAFAYTYHYLNWFSKTGVIKWHERVWSHRYLILVLWIVALGLYAYSYIVGIAALYFLSMLHVLMEFPLNIHTIRALGSRKS